MKFDYDVVVIGAGPVGAYTAYLLADRGLAVGLVERNRAVAEKVVCTGIIGKEAFERFDLPKDSILKTVRSIVFLSPSGQRLEYDHPSDLAYVVDRSRFDSEILEGAKKRGVEVKLGEKVVGVSCKAEGVQCETECGEQEYGVGSNEKIAEGRMKNAKWKEQGVNSRKYRARVVVVATGVDYRLQTALGMGSPPGFLAGAQIETEVAGVDSTVEIHTGSTVAPGSFGWVVPLGNGRSRVGVLTHPANGDPTARLYLERLVRERLHGRIGDGPLGAIRQKPIAYGPIRRSVAGRVLAVGEAAGQIKTTTGGGIFYGLVGSEMAADTIVRVLDKGNLNSDGLLEYERIWRRKLNSEFKAGYRIRSIAEKLDDAALERCFDLMKHSQLVVNLITRRINFEYHSKLLSFCLEAFSPVLR